MFNEGKNSVNHFQHLASESRFKGWPQIGSAETVADIPFFGQAIHYQLQTGNGIEDYFSIVRHFGWAVTFGVNNDNNVITLVQWKPGLNQASWELPPGGIGKIAADASFEEIEVKTKEIYQRETGYGRGNWQYLGNLLVETGKYRGAGIEHHGLPAHMFLATDLEQIQEARQPNPNEIMETLMVPLREFDDVIDSGLFKEISAMPCALLALRRLNK